MLGGRSSPLRVSKLPSSHLLRREAIGVANLVFLGSTRTKYTRVFRPCLLHKLHAMTLCAPDRPWGSLSPCSEILGNPRTARVAANLRNCALTKLMPDGLGKHQHSFFFVSSLQRGGAGKGPTTASRHKPGATGSSAGRESAAAGVDIGITMSKHSCIM
jgi:hypothetical protein